MSAVGLFAHTSAEESDAMARDAAAIAVALLTRGHRLLLHLSPSLTVPLLLAGTAWARLVLESEDRRPPPLIMLPTPWPEGPEAALFSEVEIGGGEPEGEESRRTALIERFASLGAVDLRWTRHSPVSDQGPLAILAEERPGAIVAMGWSNTMEEWLVAAQEYSGPSGARLLVAGPRRGAAARSDLWRDLATLAELPPADFEFPSDVESRSEEFMHAWETARHRARIVLAAEELARRLPE